MAATAAQQFTALAQSSSASTQRGEKSAVVHYEIFAGLQHYDKLEDSQEVDLCNVSRFQEFGKYLSEAAVDKDTGDLIMLGTALQYISGIKEIIKKKYPANEIFSPTALMATLLKDLTEMMALAPNNNVTRTFVTTAKKYGFPLSTLTAWGLLIQSDWKKKNIEAQDLERVSRLDSNTTQRA